MSNASLYPGAPDFRNRAGPSADWSATNQSPPNIRTSLFMMPLYRMGKGTDTLQSKGLYGVHKQIPFISNFNNFGNIVLDNGNRNTQTPTGLRDANDGYIFYPGTAINGSGGTNMTAAQTANQMLSGRDFAALVAHIRLRGADSYHTLESGQIGVSNATMMDQAREGWIGGTGSNPTLDNSINTRMSASDRKLLIGFENIYGSAASGGTYVQVDGGAVRNPEQTGVIMDGVYSVSQKKLDFLVSNMSDALHTVNLPPTIGGYSLNTKDFALGAGTHLLIEYSLVKSGSTNKWQSAVTSIPFTNLDEDRTRPGIPEPGMLSLLGVAGVFGMTRRRRKVAVAEL
jgi:hypothetical protein